MDSFSQNSMTPNTMAGLEKTLIELENKFKNNDNDNDHNKNRNSKKRKENPITIEEAKRDVNNNYNIEEDKRRKLNDNNLNLNISNVNNNSINPLNLNETFDQNQTLNLSVINQNNKEIVNQLNENVNAINQINDNISKMSSLKIAEYVEDDMLNEYHHKIKINQKNLYELKCIAYKLEAHISASFIPRYDRIRASIPKQKINNITKENYNYIYNTLNAMAEISKKNQISKYHNKRDKIKHYENLLNI